MNTLKVGPLSVSLQRTVRVAENQISELPANLGSIEFYRVQDFRKTCPDSWDDNAIFIPLHEKEAMWINFTNHGTPVAVMVGAGGVNALTAKKLGLTLEKENYMTVPPQPWLDGWKGEDGTVYQFVATQHKQGKGLTVAEQLIGSESKTGGIGIAVFEAKNPRELEKLATPKEEYYGGCVGMSFVDDGPIGGSCCDSDYEETSGGFECCSLGGSSRSKGLKAAELGVGKGGKIFQKIYDDPYGEPETWKTEPSAALAVYLVNAVQFTEITGMPMPPLPKAAEDYIGTWYTLKDDSYKDISGSDKFTGLKDVFNHAEAVMAENS